jgi:hypothetical protein
MTPTPLRLPALAAVLLALLGPLNTHAQERRHEIGLHVAASPERAFTVDGWFGKIRFESGPFSSAGQVKSRDKVQNIRLGLVFKY